MGPRSSGSEQSDGARAPVVEYLGHATVLLELDGVRLLTDPLLRMRVAHLRRTVRVRRSDLAVDAVLVSHGHYDHLDLPSLDRLGRSSTVVVPRGLGDVLRDRGFQQVREVEEGDELDIGGITVRATHADHEGGRPLGGPDATALGYAILGSRRIYFAGDTDLFAGMDGLVPDLDLALIPIWGWGPTLGRGKHLDPAGAAEAVRRLKPRVAVPIHWGTYRPLHRGIWSLPDFIRDPGDAFLQAARKVAPEVEVHVLAPGESLQLS